MAKKRPDPTKSRLKRFGKWSDAHRADILEELGLSEQQFRALSRGERRNKLDLGLSLDRQSKDPNFTAGPLSVEQIRANAGNAGQLRYGQAQSQLGTYGQSIDPWFQDYVQRTQALQGQQRQQAQGIIDQSVQQAQQQGQTVLGADANSEAAQNDVLAAASRKALADAFTKVLQAGQQATEGAYTQMAGVAEQSRIGQHVTQQQALKDLLLERGGFESDYVTDARDKEHTKGLERKAFGLKVADARGIDPVTGKKLPDPVAKREKQREKRQAEQEGQKVNKYGYTNEQWARFSPSHRQRIMEKIDDSDSPKSDKPKPLTPAEKRARQKDKAKQQQRYDYIEVTLRNPPTYPKGHPKAGQTPTQAEVVAQLVKQGYSKAEIKKAMRRMYPTPQRQSNTAPAGNGESRPN